MLRKKEFDELANKLGSTYAAVNYVAKESRKLMMQCNNELLGSEAITCVLTGQPPKRKHRHLSDKDLYSSSIVDDVLFDVNDDSVEESVRDSYEASLEQHHLIYCYHSELTEPQKARVRVLTNMIWYNIKQEGGF